MTLSEQIEHTRQEQLLSAVYDSRDRHRAEMETEAHTMTHDEMIAVIAAHRDGKKVEVRHLPDGAHWGHMGDRPWAFDRYDYRVAPEPKRVPLGPEDFPPGTVVRGPKIAATLWYMVTLCGRNRLRIEGCEYSYSEIMVNGWQRLLPGTTEWLPCWKEVEE